MANVILQKDKDWNLRQKWKLICLQYKSMYTSTAVQHLSPEGNEINTWQTTCKYLAINIPGVMGRDTKLQSSYWGWTADKWQCNTQKITPKIYVRYNHKNFAWVSAWSVGFVIVELPCYQSALKILGLHLRVCKRWMGKLISYINCCTTHRWDFLRAASEVQFSTGRKRNAPTNKPLEVLPKASFRETPPILFSLYFHFSNSKA